MEQNSLPPLRLHATSIISAVLMVMLLMAALTHLWTQRRLDASLEQSLVASAALLAAETETAMHEGAAVAHRIARSAEVIALAAEPDSVAARARVQTLLEVVLDTRRFPAVGLVWPGGQARSLLPEAELRDGTATPDEPGANDWRQLSHAPLAQAWYGEARHLIRAPVPATGTPGAVYALAPVHGPGNNTLAVLAIRLSTDQLLGTSRVAANPTLIDTAVLLHLDGMPMMVHGRSPQLRSPHARTVHPEERRMRQPLAELDPYPGASGEPVVAAWHPVGQSDLLVAVERKAQLARGPHDHLDRAFATLVLTLVVLLVTALILLRVGARGPLRDIDGPSPEAHSRNARLDALSELIPMGIVTVDASGTITEINRYAEQIFAANGRRLVGQAFATLLADPVVMPDHAAGMTRLSVNGLDPHGGLIPLELSIGPASDRADHTRFVIINDISEHKQLERALRQAIERRRQSEHRQRLLLDAAGEGIFGLDRHRRVSFINPTAARMLGYRPDEVLGRTLGDEPGGLGVCGADCPMLERERRDAIKGETSMLRHDGKRFEVGYSLASMQDNGGAVVVFGDITARKRTEASLMLAERVFQHITEGILVADATGRVLRVNRALCDMVGYSEAELIGQPRPPYRSGEHPPVFYQQLWDTLREEGHWEGEIWNRRRDGELFPTWQTIVAATSDDETAVEYVSVVRDITEQRRSQQRIHRLAYFDNLTGLPNRELFFDRFAHAIQRAHRQRSRLALLFLDLDRFKNVNDGLGHPVGDRLLQAVAERLQQIVRGEDTIARLGGDEFTILLESTGDRESIALVAQKVVEALSRAFPIEDHELHIGTSIGISLYPTHGEDATTLVKHADAAMYQAKSAGRNNYQFFDRSMSTSSRNRMALETRLHRAIHNEEFTLHYQPQFAADGHIVGVEALIRWQDPVMGMIPPGDFIPLTEETGLIVVIGEWALRRACQQMQHWQARGAPPIRLSVNLAGPQIVRGNIVRTVETVLRETGLDPRLLELEVTETFVMDHVEQAMDVLSGLRALGARIAIDDFGTGHSSLATLKRLPADTLKIDRAFVNDIPNDRNDIAIARAILAMARELSLETIAEGVETEAQKKFLAGEGCNYFQGFLLARPLPPEAVEPLWGNFRHLGVLA